LVLDGTNLPVEKAEANGSREIRHHICPSNSTHLFQLVSILVVVYILVYFYACPWEPAAEEERKVRLTGTVTDESTGHPIAGANVQAYAFRINRVYQSTITDQEGRNNMEYSGPFSYRNLGSDIGSQPNELSAIAEGYSSQFKQIHPTDSFQIIDFTLAPLD